MNTVTLTLPVWRDSHHTSRPATKWNWTVTRSNCTPQLSSSITAMSEKLGYHLGGPYLGKHSQWKSINNKIKQGVNKAILCKLEQVYWYGAPRRVNATNMEGNLLQCFLYGNHKSVTKNRKEYINVVVKDYKRGDNVLFNIHCFAFVPNCHLCP